MTQGWKSQRIKIHRLAYRFSKGFLNPYPGELHDPGMEITKNKNP
jgi:hypothetical protein